MRVSVVTNSLASTNHPSVHAVYSRYRKRLLKRGVNVYELRPRISGALAEESDKPTTNLTLHSKVAVIDDQKLFVGSFNLDPRSLYINTEMGLSVASEELGAEMASSILRSLERKAYSLRLAKSGALRWHYMTRNGERIAANEPHTNFWRRLRTRLMSFLPIEGQM